MKVAILSDFHLGYEKFEEDAYKQASEALFDAADKADMLIIPGDIFDNRNPRPEVLAQGINIFRTLSYHDWPAKIVSCEGNNKIYTAKPIIAIPGTHERRAIGGDDAVKLLSLAGLLADSSEMRIVVEKGVEKVAVYGIGGITDELFKKALSELSPKPLEGAFNIFFFHQSIYEFLPFSEEFIHLEDLPQGFDLYVDGHIHNRIEGKVHGKPFLIPGSTVLTQLKNAEQEQKGYYIFDTKTGEYYFNKINSRKFVSTDIDIDGLNVEESISKIDKAINEIVGAESSKPVIRVNLIGKLKEGVKHGDLELQYIIKKHANEATIEINRSGLSAEAIEVGHIEKGKVENMPIKDYGTSLFLEKLKEKKYSLSLSPTMLFDMLSSEKNKDKAIKTAMEALFKQ